jgi:hypothetical protein
VSYREAAAPLPTAARAARCVCQRWVHRFRSSPEHSFRIRSVANTEVPWRIRYGFEVYCERCGTGLVTMWEGRSPWKLLFLIEKALATVLDLVLGPISTR